MCWESNQSKVGYFLLRNHLCEREVGLLQRALLRGQFLEALTKLGKYSGLKWTKPWELIGVKTIMWEIYHHLHSWQNSSKTLRLLVNQQSKYISQEKVQRLRPTYHMQLMIC